MLSTNRLYLEPLRESHAELMFGDLQAPSLYEYHEDVPPKSLEALTRRYAFLESGQSPDGTKNGSIGLFLSTMGRYPSAIFKQRSNRLYALTSDTSFFQDFGGRGMARVR